MDDWVLIVVLMVIVGTANYLYVQARKAKKSKPPGDPLGLVAGRNAGNKRQEALFVSTFPELQPHFHPEKILQFVNAWRARAVQPGTIEWNNAPGFGSSRVRLMPKSEKGQPAELLDAAGAAISSFILQDHAEGGVIRLGSGKFTVNLRDAAVRYWHPQREFKWSKAKGWRMINSLADRPIESNDRGTSFSSDSPSSSSSWSSSSSTARTAGAVVGAGGAFDGGGASDSWDAASTSGESSGSSESSESTESRTSY